MARPPIKMRETEYNLLDNNIKNKVIKTDNSNLRTYPGFNKIIKENIPDDWDVFVKGENNSGEITCKKGKMKFSMKVSLDHSSEYIKNCIQTLGKAISDHLENNRTTVSKIYGSYIPVISEEEHTAKIIIHKKESFLSKLFKKAADVDEPKSKKIEKPSEPKSEWDDMFPKPKKKSRIDKIIDRIIKNIAWNI